MKNLKGMLLFTIAMAVLLIPYNCKADSVNCNDIKDEENLKSALSGECPTITLGGDIEISGHLEVSRELTINGNGYTIKGKDDWYNKSKEELSGDQSIITATTNGNLTLTNINLEHSPKQGAQAYGGGTLILDKVTISDCKYSGLISNGGIIHIKDLNLNTTYGIEVGKSSSNTNEQEPLIIMDGKINSTSTAIIYMDNSTSSNLKIKNEEGTINHIYAKDNKVVITDNNNKIIYESIPITSGKQIESDESDDINVYVVTIKYGENIEKIAIKENGNLSDIDLSHIKNALEKMYFVNFTTADGNIYDENSPVIADIFLTANYKTIEKTEDIENPDTSDINLYLLLSLIAVSGCGLTYTVKKRFN